jgi:hypothetical protein
LNRKTSSGITIVAIVFLVIFFFIFNNNQYVKSSVDTVGKTFASGDAINIIQQPIVLPPEIQKLLQTSNSTEITTTDLPSSFTSLAVKQQLNQTTVTNKSEITGNLYKGTISSNAELVATQIETGIPVHHSGDVVFVAGQIHTNKLPQALTITVTCCGMDAYIQIPHYPTDGQGNFAFPIKTSSSFPLGLWTATITWTGNDGILKSYNWQFTLVN